MSNGKCTHNFVKYCQIFPPEEFCPSVIPPAMCKNTCFSSGLSTECAAKFVDFCWSRIGKGVRFYPPCILTSQTNMVLWVLPEDIRFLGQRQENLLFTVQQEPELHVGISSTCPRSPMGMRRSGPGGC